MNQPDMILPPPLPVDELRPLGPPLFKRLQQLIADDMPTGEHLERAAAWRRLAARCLKTADRHEQTAIRRGAVRNTVRAFAPRYRQHVIEALKSGAMTPIGELQDAPEGSARIVCDRCERTVSPEEFANAMAGSEWYCGAHTPDPENGTWRSLTDGERSTRQVLRSSGKVDWLTEQEQRDGRTAEPPRWFVQLYRNNLMGDD